MFVLDAVIVAYFLALFLALTFVIAVGLWRVCQWIVSCVERALHRRHECDLCESCDLDPGQAEQELHLLQALWDLPPAERCRPIRRRVRPARRLRRALNPTSRKASR